MVFLALMATAAMAPGDGKTAALDDWHAMTILEVGGESGPYYLHVKTGDLDGDGKADDATVKLRCADGKVQQALLRPRELGIGSPDRAAAVRAGENRQGVGTGLAAVDGDEPDL